MSLHMFYEPTPGAVAHTADSRLLATDPLLFDWVGMMQSEVQPASLRLCEALDKWPGSEEPNHSAYNIANDTGDPFYKHLMNYPERMRQFASSMTHLAKNKAIGEDWLTKLYPWEEIAN